MGFFSPFSPYSRCLTDLTSKRTQKVRWTQELEDSFKMLKQLLCEAVEKPLYIIDYSAPMHIQQQTLQIMPLQDFCSRRMKTAIKNPIVFTSQKLTDSQARSLSTIEKKSYAVIHSLRKFRDWVLLSELHIYCDHNPLQKTPRKALSLHVGHLRFKSST